MYIIVVFFNCYCTAYRKSLVYIFIRSNSKKFGLKEIWNLLNNDYNLLRTPNNSYNEDREYYRIKLINIKY